MSELPYIKNIFKLKIGIIDTSHHNLLRQAILYCHTQYETGQCKLEERTTDNAAAVVGGEAGLKYSLLSKSSP